MAVLKYSRNYTDGIHIQIAKNQPGLKVKSMTFIIFRIEKQMQESCQASTFPELLEVTMKKNSIDTSASESNANNSSRTKDVRE